MEKRNIDSYEQNGEAADERHYPNEYVSTLHETTLFRSVENPETAIIAERGVCEAGPLASRDLVIEYPGFAVRAGESRSIRTNSSERIREQPRNRPAVVEKRSVKP